MLKNWNNEVDFINMMLSCTCTCMCEKYWFLDIFYFVNLLVQDVLKIILYLVAYLDLYKGLVKAAK